VQPHTQRRIADYLLFKTKQAFVTSHSRYGIEQFTSQNTFLLTRTRSKESLDNRNAELCVLSKLTSCWRFAKLFGNSTNLTDARCTRVVTGWIQRVNQVLRCHAGVRLTHAVAVAVVDHPHAAVLVPAPTYLLFLRLFPFSEALHMLSRTLISFCKNLRG
jgi:hypothetical protein